MTDHSNSRIRVTLLMVAIVALSAVAMPAVAMTYDNETTNTSTTSDWQQGTTVTDLDNSSNVSTIEVQSNNASSGDDFKLEVSVNDSDSAQDGQTVYTSTESWTATNSSAGHYQLNVTHSEVFRTVERGAGETVTLDVTVIVNESETSEEKKTIQIDAKNGDSTGVIAAEDGEDSLTTSNKTGFADFDISSATLMFWKSDDSSDDSFDGAAKNAESVNVSAENTTTVRMELVDSETSDAASTVMEEASSGDFLGTAGAKIAGDRVPVFAESASDVSWVDTSSDVYATLDGNTVTYHNVNKTVDSSGDVEFTASLNDGIGVGAADAMLSDFDDLSTTEKWRLAIGANDFNGDAFGDSII